MARPDDRASPPPTHRRLRAYTFDPSLATQLDTALINETVIMVPWEAVEPGPSGDYLEVIDHDPASDCFYPPVNLNDPHLLATDGLAPSEGNPHFHQQMVYAVAMTTIHNFERALGRRALWAPRLERDATGGIDRIKSKPVLKLRVYPHALREANAYYSPEKKALLFGYFPAVLANPGENLPGGLVFTCLSHDVIAHETTHALLDGLHRYFAEPSNPDVLAFHEAFADVVALFQHFTQPEALRHQIAKTRGNLSDRNLLGELAHQFGQAIGNHGALRDAIGRIDPETKRWKAEEPDPGQYPATTEPHARGAILVAAMFDAFQSVYAARVADLLRIATGGSGVLPAGHIHPDLVNRMAREATETAAHLLRMAIRALDYCPPVDVTFGEYLRGLVTGDYELAPDDPLGYRIAVIEAFRRRGIFPRDVRTLAADALRWQPPAGPRLNFAPLLRVLKSSAWPETLPGTKTKSPRRRIPDADSETLEWQTFCARERIDGLNLDYQFLTWHWVMSRFIEDQAQPDRAWWRPLGLTLDRKAPATIYRSKSLGVYPALELHSVRSARRQHQDGRTIIDLVIEMTQRRRGYADAKRQAEVDALPPDDPKLQTTEYDPDFTFRGGCTLLIDGETGEVRYAIVKNIDSEHRLARQRAFLTRAAPPSLRATYTRPTRDGLSPEPFAMLHRRG